MRHVSRILGLSICLLGTGCITTAGNQLGDIRPEVPRLPLNVEQTVGDFSFHLEGGKMITSNKAGRILNDEILGRWEEKGFIAESSYVKSGEFTGNAPYNLTLSGHQEGESNVFLQFLSGFTLALIPYYVNTRLDLTYTLEHAATGASFEAKAADSHRMVGPSWPLLPVAPFFQGGRIRTLDRLADHLYAALASQGAFDTRGSAGPEPAGQPIAAEASAVSPAFEREAAKIETAAAGIWVPIEYDAGFGVRFDVTLAIDDQPERMLEPGQRILEELTPGEHVLKLADPKSGMLSKPDWGEYSIILDPASIREPSVVIEARNKLVGFSLAVIIKSRGSEVERHEIDLQ